MLKFFFKKKEKVIQNIEVTSIEYLKLKKIIQALPKEYHFIEDQINDSFLKYRYENKSLGDNWFSFGLDQEKLEEFESVNIEFAPRIVSNICITTKSNINVYIKLYFIAKGIFGAYQLNPNIDLADLQIEKINTEKIEEKIFINQELKSFKNKISCISKSEIINYLDLDDSFVLEAFDKPLRTIKYFGNGNYLCVDNDFNLYKAINNPIKLEKTGLNLKQINSVNEIEQIISSY